MAEIEGEFSNLLFETLSDWEHQLKHSRIRFEELRP